MPEHLTAKEAADKLGYEYTYFLRLVREGKVPGAEWWQGYLIPATVTREEVGSKVGRPRKLS